MTVSSLSAAAHPQGRIKATSPRCAVTGAIAVLCVTLDASNEAMRDHSSAYFRRTRFFSLPGSCRPGPAIILPRQTISSIEYKVAQGLGWQVPTFTIQPVLPSSGWLRSSDAPSHLIRRSRVGGRRRPESMTNAPHILPSLVFNWVGR